VLNIVHWLGYISYTRHFGFWLIHFVFEVSYENLGLETGPLYYPWINGKNTVLTHD